MRVELKGFADDAARIARAASDPGNGKAQAFAVEALSAEDRGQRIADDLNRIAEREGRPPIVAAGDPRTQQALEAKILDEMRFRIRREAALPEHRGKTAADLAAHLMAPRTRDGLPATNPDGSTIVEDVPFLFVHRHTRQLVEGIDRRARTISQAPRWTDIIIGVPAAPNGVTEADVTEALAPGGGRP